MSDQPAQTESVLLIDDDVQLCEMLRNYLGGHGWHVSSANTGNEGLRLAQQTQPDLIVLDVMLPDLDGFDVLRQLHRRNAYKVLMLTARGQEIDRIVGLELGADDYLGKPFNPRELLARMKAILRRSGKPETTALTPAIGQFLIDDERRQIAFGEQLLPLTDVEFTLLQQLLLQSTNILTRDELSQALFGRPQRPFERTLDMHVSRLRRKLQTIKNFQGGIRSIRNSGYMFVNDTER